MPAKDEFDPDQALPRFLAVQAEQDDVPGEPVGPSRASKVRVLIITAAAAGIAVLAIGNPVALVAEVSALLTGNSVLPAAPIQSAADAPALIAAATADAQDLPRDLPRESPPASNDASARAEIAVEPIAKDQTEGSEASSEALFRQFQAWAADQDAQKQSAAVEPVQDAPPSIMQDLPPAAKNLRVRARHAQKRAPVRAAVRNARAEVRAQSLRRQTPPPPAQQAPAAPGPATQDGQTAPFLGIFGQRN